jgi:Na+/H+ antiporter NhaD/arsenite permease-like protein
MAKSLIASAAMIVLFFAGLPVPKVALIAGALLLLTRRVKPEKVYREIDWSLLVLFIGLFIMIGRDRENVAPGRSVRRRRPLPSRAHRAHEHLRRAAF